MRNEERYDEQYIKTKHNENIPSEVTEIFPSGKRQKEIIIYYISLSFI